MSEQRPLLYEDFCEEDPIKTYFHRRIRPSSFRGRAKYHVRGAAAIINKWPGQWASLVIYWWIGIGMIALITFILYYCIFSYAMIPPIKYRQVMKPATLEDTNKTPNVFMHLFVNKEEEIDLNKYLPYIDIVSKEFKNFQYNIIIVTNDTTDAGNYTDQANNKLALKRLFTETDKYKKVLTESNNVGIKHTTIRNCLNDSPVQKFWTEIPTQFIEYLVRATAIWQHGGIALNPLILTPQSPNTAYIHKIRKVLSNFKKKTHTDRTPHMETIKTTLKKQKSLPVVNNIYDIINALDRNDISDNSNGEILTAAESFVVPKYAPSKIISHLNVNESKVTKDRSHHEGTKYEGSNDQNDIQVIDTTRSNLLPMFLEYFLHKNHSKSEGNEVASTTKAPKNSPTEMTKVKENHNLQTFSTLNDVMIDTESYTPVIVSASGIYAPYDKEVKKSSTNMDSDRLFELILDFKGYVIASEVPCHAFLGGMFVNSIAHDQSETLTDFIIKELTIFCNGLLATCMGIDVIIL